MKGTDRHFFHDNITNMGEVRACVYFSVIFLCIQISAAKPLFGDWFWCDLFCEDDDGLTTTPNSNEDYLDAFCGECPTRRPRPATTPMPPVFPNPGTPMPPGMFPPPGMPGPPGGPGPVNYFMMNPPQNGGPQNFNMVPDPNRNGWWSFVWNPAGGPGSATQAPNATPAPVAPPTTAAPPATAAPAAPAAAATTAAPAVTTAAPAA